MRKFWAPALLVLLCACESGENPLPKEGDLKKQFPERQVSAASHVIQAPKEALLCVLGPYEISVHVPSPAAADMNKALERSRGSAWPGENEWSLVLLAGGQLYSRTYSFRGPVRPLLPPDLKRLAEAGWTFARPDGFTPVQCAPMETAAVLRTDFDAVTTYLILGTTR